MWVVPAGPRSPSGSELVKPMELGNIRSLLGPPPNPLLQEAFQPAGSSPSLLWLPPFHQCLISSGSSWRGNPGRVPSPQAAPCLLS